jgi:ribosomal protein L40E
MNVPSRHTSGSPSKTASDRDQRVCVRCRASSSPDAPLIATPEGWMCDRCYADAK